MVSVMTDDDSDVSLMILFSVWTAIIVIVDDDNINVDGH
jgi:hypothetical protein